MIGRLDFSLTSPTLLFTLTVVVVLGIDDVRRDEVMDCIPPIDRFCGNREQVRCIWDGGGGIDERSLPCAKTLSVLLFFLLARGDAAFVTNALRLLLAAESNQK